ncbi:hypothetical protein ROZALSC1DRAFT_24841 [Rozella allomycis CSF55]|nr:hypothetical protein ROZALSC1DRAFT_24841 [Rozella allomycis CSF55]
MGVGFVGSFWTQDFAQIPNFSCRPTSSLSNPITNTTPTPKASNVTATIPSSTATPVSNGQNLVNQLMSTQKQELSIDDSSSTKTSFVPIKRSRTITRIPTVLPDGRRAVLIIRRG